MHSYVLLMAVLLLSLALPWVRETRSLLECLAAPSQLTPLFQCLVFGCGVQWVSRVKYKHRVGVTVMLLHGALPASGHVWLRNLRDQRRCVSDWKPLMDFSPVNLSDSLLNPRKLKPSTRCQ